jgi:hypothetical protein
MPTITKSIKIVLILCATLTTSCAKTITFYPLNTEGKSKTTKLYLGKDLTLSTNILQTKQVTPIIFI